MKLAILFRFFYARLRLKKYPTVLGPQNILLSRVLSQYVYFKHRGVGTEGATGTRAPPPKFLRTPKSALIRDEKCPFYRS